jgi:hypothetical protein
VTFRRAAKVDRNQAEIVAALRAVGATVQPLHSVGAGCPDLLVGYRGRNWLIEVKDWQASSTDRKLNPRQIEWHEGWKGQVAKVEDVSAALAVIGHTGLHLAGFIS